MEEKKDSKYTLIALVLLSVLLHLFLVMPFITIQLDLLPPSPLLEKLEELHQEVRQHMPQEEWAAIVPQGAPVILVDQQEMPEQFIEQEEQPVEVPDMQEAPSQEEISLQEKNNQEEPPQPEEPQPVHPELPLETTVHKIPIQKPVTMPKKPAPLAKVQTLKKPTQPKPSLQQTAYKKPKLTLAQLAEGFAHHMEQEGDLSIAIAMAGKSNAKATESQLRIGRFLQKVLDGVKTSWVTQKRHYPLSHPIQISIHFNMSINKDGSLHGITITQSSGSSSLDAYITGIIKDASSSFPPIPDYLNWNICTVRCDWDNLPLPNTPIQFIISQ